MEEAGASAQPSEDDGADEVTIQEEVAPLKTAPAPIKPCAADVEEHNITHMPYRSWCDSCVGGRGFAEPTKSQGSG